jgi:predicted nucleic acid-binding protein
MPEIIISDASCIIILDKISKLEILKELYGDITVTSIIAQEYGKPLQNWIKVKDPLDKNYQTILELELDEGEASAIALAIESKESILILDDEKARKTAISLGLKITGTFGVVISAKNEGYISSVKEVIDKIKQTNFRISEPLEKEILKKAGE